VVVLKNEDARDAELSCSGTTTLAKFARPSVITAFGPRWSPQFDQEIGEHANGRYFDLLVQPGEAVLTPLFQADDPRRRRPGAGSTAAH
jgi:hypothetical protein